MTLSRNFKQAGFAALEVIVVIVVLIALAGAGYWIYGQQSRDAKDGNGQEQTISNDDAEAPLVKDRAGLDASEQLLEDVNLGSSPDGEQLETQANEF